MKPKKSFGQNFLTSVAARAAIVNAGNIIPNEIVLEIGPGRGFLTEGLLDAGAHVIALEADRDLIPLLEVKFKLLPPPPTHPQALGRGALQLIHCDALKYDTTLIKSSYKLIANIPYNITGAIIEKYLSAIHKPSAMIILVQKEVAERIVSRDGNESILSIAVRIYGEPRIVHKVSAGSFHPKPKVDSAVLAIYNINNDFFESFAHVEADVLAIEKLFFTVLRGGFHYKRKYLLNNITEIIIRESLHSINAYDENFDNRESMVKDKLRQIFLELDIDEQERAENVRIEKWKLLFSLIYARLLQ